MKNLKELFYEVLKIRGKLSTIYPENGKEFAGLLGRVMNWKDGSWEIHLPVRNIRIYPDNVCSGGFLRDGATQNFFFGEYPNPFSDYETEKICNAFALTIAQYHRWTTQPDFVRPQFLKILSETSLMAVTVFPGRPDEWFLAQNNNPIKFFLDYSEKVTPTPDKGELWVCESEVPSPEPGKLQIGWIDSGFCQPKYKIINGLTESEKRLADNKLKNLIKISGRDLRDEFDGDNCPKCGKRFCTLNWTKKICPDCENAERYEYQEKYEKFTGMAQAIRRDYKGTRLFKQFQKAGIPQEFWC